MHGVHVAGVRFSTSRKIMFKRKIILIVIVVLILIVASLRFFSQEDDWICQNGEWIKHGNPEEPKPEELCGVQKGLVVSSPKPDEVISSPLTITGYVNGENWIVFEAQTGTVELQDANGKMMAFGLLTATDEDWMKPLVNFSSTMEFSRATSETGVLIFRNENPSGESEREREIRLPVKFTNFSTETMKVKVFFGNSNLDSEYTCVKVFPAERIVPKSTAVARASLEELLLGVSRKESDEGYFTNINSGVKVQSLIIENGTAKIDFNSRLEEGGGSCRTSSIKAQITQTLKQFPIVKNVIISIDGRTEDILQP